MSESSWKGEHARETWASLEAVWSAWSDVGSWRQWNAGIERIELEGPFASGTWFTMLGPGAAEVGPRVSSGFPQVLAALAAFVEGRPA